MTEPSTNGSNGANGGGGRGPDGRFLRGNPGGPGRRRKPRAGEPIPEELSVNDMVGLGATVEEIAAVASLPVDALLALQPDLEARCRAEAVHRALLLADAHWRAAVAGDPKMLLALARPRGAGGSA